MSKSHQQPESHDVWKSTEAKLSTLLNKAPAWQMVQNLGSCVKEFHGASTPKKFLRKIFIEAFGEDIGEAKLKNRKRYILLPDEVKGRTSDDLKDNQVAKSGPDFLSLAKAIEPNYPDYIKFLGADIDSR